MQDIRYIWKRGDTSITFSDPCFIDLKVDVVCNDPVQNDPTAYDHSYALIPKFSSQSSLCWRLTNTIAVQAWIAQHFFQALCCRNRWFDCSIRRWTHWHLSVCNKISWRLWWKEVVRTTRYWRRTIQFEVHFGLRQIWDAKLGAKYWRGRCSENYKKDLEKKLFGYECD